MITDMRTDLVGFDHPTNEPVDSEQRQKWQDANQSWWEGHPMRYDWNEELGFEEFSREFYQEIDRRFFASARTYLPWKSVPFDPLIDFDSLGQKNVLEIGVGNGSHALLLAQYAQSFTGIDLTSYAVHSTTERMKCFQLDADILQMDAEKMDFPDDSFDFIWSWGVIHHSSNTRAIIQEIRRVLRPGGKATVMVYHRSFLNYYIFGLLFRGILQADLIKTRSLCKTVQRATDGALARFYSIHEWRQLVSLDLNVDSIRVYGDKPQLFPIPPGAFKDATMKMFPNSVSRFLLNRCRLGSFLVSEISKPV